jgi:hypothetical protein
LIEQFGNQKSAAVAFSIDSSEQSRISKSSPRANVAVLAVTTASLGQIPKQFVKTSRARRFFLACATLFQAGLQASS